MNDLTQGSVYEFNNSLFLKGDFIGFTFDGIHSSELGIVRVSGGDRYEEALVPSLSLKTTNVPGGDGSYYFGTSYTQRNINLQIAFDSLTQQQFMRLISVFGTKKISTLIFDENPYKVYNVKISSEPKLNYICFDEDNKRILKDTIDLKLNNNGSVMKDDQAVGLLNLGNKGDNCVTLIRFDVPENFKSQYYLY